MSPLLSAIRPVHLGFTIPSFGAFTAVHASGSEENPERPAHTLYAPGHPAGCHPLEPPQAQCSAARPRSGALLTELGPKLRSVLRFWVTASVQKLLDSKGLQAAGNCLSWERERTVQPLHRHLHRCAAQGPAPVRPAPAVCPAASLPRCS